VIGGLVKEIITLYQDRIFRITYFKKASNYSSKIFN